jgi:hypothetical protein
VSAPTPASNETIEALVGLIEAMAQAETDLEVATETADMALTRVISMLATMPEHAALADSVRETRDSLLDCLRGQGIID